MLGSLSKKSMNKIFSTLHFQSHFALGLFCSPSVWNTSINNPEPDAPQHSDAHAKARTNIKMYQDGDNHRLTTFFLVNLFPLLRRFLRQGCRSKLEVVACDWLSSTHAIIAFARQHLRASEVQKTSAISHWLKVWKNLFENGANCSFFPFLSLPCQHVLRRSSTVATSLAFYRSHKGLSLENSGKKSEESKTSRELKKMLKNSHF